MGFCGECGAHLPPNLQGAFCPECGEAIPGAARAVPSPTPSLSSPVRHVTFSPSLDAESEATRRREEAERQARDARERAEAMKLSAQNAISEYEAQQRAAVERENARRQQELETQRQQHLYDAQAARERREEAERLAQEKLARAERLRNEAQAAQEEMKIQEAKRAAKEKQREEARRLREEQARREENRRRAEEEERKAFEAKRQEEQLRQEALRLSSLSVMSKSDPSTPAPTPVNLVCVSCRCALKPAQKFCLQCGTKVAAGLPLSTTSMSLTSVAPSSSFSSLPRTNSASSNTSSSSSRPNGEHNCASCQFTLKATQKFCPKCGTKVAPAAPALQAPSPVSLFGSASSAQVPSATLAAPSACTKCSQALKPAQKFCLHCGTKVIIPAASTPSLSSSFSSSSSSYTSVPLPAPIPASGSCSASSLQPSTKNCPTCGKECKGTAKFCMGCGFNFSKSDDEEVARNMERAYQRQQQMRDREQQQRNQASLMANQAAQAYQPSW